MAGFHDLNIKKGCTYIKADPYWKRKLFWGGLILMLPIVGWPMVLGYRKEVVGQLVHGREPLLPEWEGGLFYYLREGLRCIGVIFCYLAPTIIYVTATLVSRGSPEWFPWHLFFLFFTLFPLFSPLALPGLVTYFAFYLGVVWSYQEAILILFAFHILVFLIPLGFLQVSQTGKYLSAFNIPSCLMFLKSNFRNYIAAWVFSGLVSLFGHFAIPFSPWGIVWAYLAIVFYFNQILFVGETMSKGVSKQWFKNCAYKM